MPANTSSTERDAYSMRTGESAVSRLELLHDVYGPSTRRWLQRSGLRPGMRVLDLGCGTGPMACWLAGEVGPTGSVVGVDLGEDQLQYAVRRCHACTHAPVSYLPASAYDTGLPEAGFDLIHVRFLLCHLTEPGRALREIFRLLKPGGRLICRDIYLSAIVADCEALRRSVALAHVLGHALGINYDFGAQLPAAVAAAGFQLLDAAADLPTFLTGPGKRLWEITFAEALPAFERTGTATAAEVAEILAVMQAAVLDPTRLLSPWAAVDISAQRPA